SPPPISVIPPAPLPEAEVPGRAPAVGGLFSLREATLRAQRDLGSASFGLMASSADDIRFSATLIGQTAHPFAASVGFVRIESAGTSQPLANPLTAPMAALLQGHPTPAGQPAPLQVESLVVTVSGLRVRFNQAFDPRELGGADAVASRIVVLRDKVPVKGRIVLDPDGEGFTFIADGAPLPAGEYTVRLVSGAKGFAKPNGDALDGDYDGKAGGDFRGSFRVAAPVRVGASDAGSGDAAAARLAAMAPAPAPSIGLAGDIGWMADRWTVPAGAAGGRFDSAEPSGATWAAFTGGIGGVVSLLAAPGATGRRAPEAGMVRRALAAGRRRLLGAGEGDLRETIRIAAPAASPESSPAHLSPAWVSQWLGKRKRATNDWQIRP
ncbi:MAG: hypothetical protein ABI699_19115, partial [Caldimonas sp.]